MAAVAPGYEPTGSEPPPCYNCGMRGHMFFACPEPTRQIPAGLEASRARQHAAGDNGHTDIEHAGNHHKGMVITRYSHPPLHAGLGGTPYEQPPHGRSTPLGAIPDYPYSQYQPPGAPGYAHPLPPPYSPSQLGPPPSYAPQPYGAGSYADPYSSSLNPPHSGVAGTAVPPAPPFPPPGPLGPFPPGMPHPYGQSSFTPHGSQLLEYPRPPSSGIPPGPFPGPPREPPPIGPFQSYPVPQYTSYTGPPPASHLTYPSHTPPPSQQYSYRDDRSPPRFDRVRERRSFRQRDERSFRGRREDYRDDRHRELSPRNGMRPRGRRGRDLKQTFERGDRHMSRDLLRGQGGPDRPDPVRGRNHIELYRSPSLASTSLPSSLPRRPSFNTSSQATPTSRHAVTGSPAPTTSITPLDPTSSKTGINVVHEETQEDSFSDTDDDNSPYKGYHWDMQAIFMENPAENKGDPIAEPLPSEYTEKLMLPPAFGARCVRSKYITPENLDDFALGVAYSDDWKSYKYHPLFLEPTKITPKCLATYFDAISKIRGPRNDRRERTDQSRVLGKHNTRDHARNHRDYEDRQVYKGKANEPRGLSSNQRKRRWEEFVPEGQDHDHFDTRLHSHVPWLIDAKRPKPSSPEPGEISDPESVRAEAPNIASNTGHGWQQDLSSGSPSGPGMRTNEPPRRDILDRGSSWTEAGPSPTNGEDLNHGRTSIRVRAKQEQSEGLKVDTSLAYAPALPKVARSESEIRPLPYGGPLSRRGSRASLGSRHGSRRSSFGHPSQDGSGGSPLTPMEAELLGMTPLDSSDSDTDRRSPRQQRDESTPKAKRRQPVVDVYSRRW